MKQSRIEKGLFLVTLLGALLACKAMGGKDDSSDDSSGDTASASGDKVGVKECDEFLEKYEKCLTSSTKIPSEAKESFKDSIKQMRDSWKQAASVPGGKAGLKQGCEQSLESTKKAMEAYNCEW